MNWRPPTCNPSNKALSRWSGLKSRWNQRIQTNLVSSNRCPIAYLDPFELIACEKWSWSWRWRWNLWNRVPVRSTWIPLKVELWDSVPRKMRWDACRIFQINDCRRTKILNAHRLHNESSATYRRNTSEVRQSPMTYDISQRFGPEHHGCHRQLACSADGVFFCTPCN